MAQDKEFPKTTAEIIREFFNANGEPAEVAGYIDDIIFDWIGSHVEELQDWHKDRIHTLKCVRNLFKTLKFTTD